MNTRTHNKLATEIEREWNEPKPKQCHDAKQAKKHCNAEIYQKISRSLFRFTAFSSSSEKRGSSRKELWDEQYSIHLLVMLLYTVAFFIVGFCSSATYFDAKQCSQQQQHVICIVNNVFSICNTIHPPLPPHTQTLSSISPLDLSPTYFCQSVILVLKYDDVTALLSHSSSTHKKSRFLWT